MTITAPDLFRLLADETRLRCLVLLYLEGELCVCELVHALDEIQPKVSRHLAVLRDQGIVSDRRAGQWVYYRIANELPDWVHDVLQSAVAWARGHEPFLHDQHALAHMPGRPDIGRCA